MRVSGGDLEGGGFTIFSGYSAKAQRTGKPAHLEPNGGPLQNPIGSRPVLALFTAINRPEAEPFIPPLNKGG
jgi:hypothetical protein